MPFHLKAGIADTLAVSIRLLATNMSSFHGRTRSHKPELASYTGVPAGFFIAASMSRTVLAKASGTFLEFAEEAGAGSAAGAAAGALPELAAGADWA